jgi:hypothetical protein
MLYQMRYKGADERYHWVTVRIVQQYSDGKLLVERQDDWTYALAHWSDQ